MKSSIYWIRTAAKVILIAALPILLSQCKPDDPKKPDDTVVKKGLVLQFKPVCLGSDITFSSGEYTRSNGEIMLFTNWAMIWSKLSLVKTDNSLVSLGDGYLFIDGAGAKTTYTFADAPAGEYKGISFELGLDSIINHGDPNAWPADHPLNGNYTGLHWGWSTGYIFQAIDGRYKKDAAQTDWSGMSLHTATDKYPRTFMLPLSFTLDANGQKTATITGRIEQYFQDPTFISFAKDGSFSHSVGAAEISLMDKIVNNGSDVFELTSVK